MGNIKNLQNHKYHVPEESRERKWTWKSPSGVTKAKIDYTLTNRPDIVTHVTVINQVNIGRTDWTDISTIKHL